MYVYAEESNVSGMVNKNSSSIVSGYYILYNDALDNEWKYLSKDFPYVSHDTLSGYSIIISGEVTYDTSGIIAYSKDPAGKPISGEINEVKNLVSGKYDVQNLQSYRNSGIIYGKHLTDDIDMNIRVKRENHIRDSLQLVANSKPGFPLVHPYSQSDLNKIIVTREGLFQDGILITVDTSNSIFNNYPFTFFSNGSYNPEKGKMVYTNVGAVDDIDVIFLKWSDSDPGVAHLVPGLLLGNIEVDVQTNEEGDVSIVGEDIISVRIPISRNTDSSSSMGSTRYVPQLIYPSVEIC
jgi:hypothetical protein